VLLPPMAPFTDQVTPVFDVFWSVAVNACVPFVSKLAEVGLTLTVIGGGDVTVTPRWQMRQCWPRWWLLPYVARRLPVPYR